MKPKNFPQNKLIRKMTAQGIDLYTKENQKLLDQARKIRTKKRRG